MASIWHANTIQKTCMWRAFPFNKFLTRDFTSDKPYYGCAGSLCGNEWNIAVSCSVHRTACKKKKKGQNSKQSRFYTAKRHGTLSDFPFKCLNCLRNFWTYCTLKIVYLEGKMLTVSILSVLQSKAKMRECKSDLCQICSTLFKT